MKFFRIKFFINILAILLLLGFGYYYHQDINRLLQELLHQWQPCRKPITYSIANFDSRFGLTEAELLDNIKQAEKIWESSINQELFEYSPAGNLKINFIYDNRQQAMDELEEIGLVINNDRSTYDTLKSKYDLLITSYNKEKARIESLLATYNADTKVFEKDVNYWNSHGGAPEAEYKLLEQQRVNLNNQATIINQAQTSLNELIDTLNAAEIVLNKLIVTLNLQVDTYNTVSSSTGRQFNAGEYVSDSSITTINIFQFNNTNQLVRILAHEFGHALGLEHIDNPKAIMYYLNEEGVNEKLTPDDLTALKNACKIK